MILEEQYMLKYTKGLIGSSNSKMGRQRKGTQDRR